MCFVSDLTTICIVSVLVSSYMVSGCCENTTVDWLNLGYNNYMVPAIVVRMSSKYGE